MMPTNRRLFALSFRFSILLVAAPLLAVGCGADPAPTESSDPAPTESSDASTSEVEQIDYPYRVGVGIRDVTGPVADIQMWGYARDGQRTAGLHFRQFARAYVIAEPEGGERVALVVADLGAIFFEVQREVVKKLQSKFGDDYSLQNVVLSATHTHSGGGGFWQYSAGSSLAGEYHAEYFDLIVAQIVGAISDAHDSLAPGNVLIARGEVKGAGANRSVAAYEANPAEERAKYDSNMDQTMTLLRFVTEAGDIGALNWFAVHPTSMTYNNRLISGDHKGYAAYLLEKLKSGEGRQFVGAFANSNAGDITSNLNLNNTGPGVDEFDSTRIIGKRQYEKAAELLDAATEPLAGPIDYRQTFVNFSNLVVESDFTGTTSKTTCPSAYGYTFAAGSTEDGGGLPLFFEGHMKRNSLIDSLVGERFGYASDECRACQAPKVVLFSLGDVKPEPLQSQILPISLVRIGQLALIAMPAEVTTMAGRRIRGTVEGLLGEGAQGSIKYSVIAAYTNDYGGYVTTNEEYNTQQYEGGHTLYGPWTQAAYTQEFTKLARAMADGTEVTWEDSPRDVSADAVSTPLGTDFDTIPEGIAFGQVFEDAATSYSLGSRASATFWTGNPQNFYPIRNFIKVRRNEGEQWTTVASDRDWETRLYWNQVEEAPTASLAMVTWDIPADAEPGTYRILYHGGFKVKTGGAVGEFTAESSAFEVR